MKGEQTRLLATRPSPLVRDAQAELASRFERLYLTHAQSAMRLAYVLTRDRDQAEDLVAEAFTKIFGRLRVRSEPAEFEAYLRRTILNLSLSLFRRHKTEREYLERQSRESPLFGQDSDLPDEVWRAILELSARQRAVVYLRFYEDLSEHQIAEAMSFSPAAARSQLFRAMKNLRNDLGREHGS